MCFHVELFFLIDMKGPLILEEHFLEHYSKQHFLWILNSYFLTYFHFSLVSTEIEKTLFNFVHISTLPYIGVASNECK